MTRLSFVIVLVSFCIALTGCPDTPAPTKPSEPGPAPAATPTAPAEATAEKPAEPTAGFNLNPDFAINYDDNFHSHGQGRFGGLLAILGSHQFHAEFLPDATTGNITAILYDDHFKPVKSAAKELTVSLLVDGEPKQFSLLVDFEGSNEKPALYKISDAALAKLLNDGWTGNALVSITVDDKPASGKLIPLKK